MFLNDYYIKYSNNIDVYSIISYQNILTNFINVFIKYYKNEKNENIIYNESIIYSKYFLFYKTMGCNYDKNIMKVLTNVDYIIKKNMSTKITVVKNNQNSENKEKEKIKNKK